MHPTRSRYVVPLLLALAFVAGGFAPARAGTTSVEDALVRQLERISDSLRELAHREPVRVVCECKSGDR